MSLLIVIFPVFRCFLVIMLFCGMRMASSTYRLVFLHLHLFITRGTMLWYVKKKILWQASKFKMVFLMTGDFHLLLDQRMWQKGPIMWGFIHRRQNIFWVGKLGIFVSWSNETKHIGWIVRISVGHYCLLIRNFDCLNTDRKKQTPYTRLGIHTIRYLTSFTSS